MKSRQVVPKRNLDYYFLYRAQKRRGESDIKSSEHVTKNTLLYDEEYNITCTILRASDLLKGQLNTKRISVTRNAKNFVIASYDLICIALWMIELKLHHANLMRHAKRKTILRKHSRAKV